jgi:DNA-binding NarL/FixJ family response regulator
MNRAYRWSWLLGRRVFIIWTHPLFYESVRLLLSDPEIEIVGETEDLRSAHSAIAQLRPDTVIVEELGEGAPSEFLSVLESSQWPSRVIGFSLNDNRLNIYRHEKRNAGKAADLRHLVISD